MNCWIMPGVLIKFNFHRGTAAKAWRGSSVFSVINYRPKEGVTKWIVPDTGIRKPLSKYSPSGS